MKKETFEKFVKELDSLDTNPLWKLLSDVELAQIKELANSDKTISSNEYLLMVLMRINSPSLLESIITLFSEELNTNNKVILMKLQYLLLSSYNKNESNLSPGFARRMQSSWNQNGEK